MEKSLRCGKSLCIQNLYTAFFARKTLAVSNTAFLIAELLLKFIIQLLFYNWIYYIYYIWDLRNIIWLLSISTFCKKKNILSLVEVCCSLLLQALEPPKEALYSSEHHRHWVSLNWDTHLPTSALHRSWINLWLAAWGVLDVSTGLLGRPFLLNFSSIWI